MKSLDALFKADATALSLRQKRLEILGSNIANAATPHFNAGRVGQDGLFVLLGDRVEFCPYGRQTGLM